MSNKTSAHSPSKAKYRRASDVEQKRTKWIWHPRIPAGNITILGGRGGVGKGVSVSDFVARVTHGDPWPGEKECAPKGTVIWCEAEDSFEYTIAPRLTAADADLSKVFLMKPAEFFDLDLKTFIKEHEVKLIVMSPLNSFLPELKDANHALNVRRSLEDLQQIIEGTDCAIFALCHLNKKVDLDSVDRLLGSVEYTNVARSVLLMRAEKNSAQVRMALMKHNLGPPADDLLFEVRNTRPKDSRSQYIAVKWSKAEKNVDKDHFLDRRERADDKLPAHTWLTRHLGATGECPVRDVIKAGISAGYSESALKGAQQNYRSRIISRQSGFGRNTTTWRVDQDAH